MGYKIVNKIRYCQKCDKKIWMPGFNTQNHITHIMDKKNLCYDCAFWEELIAYPPEYMEIVNNQCLRLHPVGNNKDKTLILGGKGKMRYFMRHDGSLIQSNDIWVVGTIPERFASQLPATAVEITSKAFKKLTTSNRKCFARACFDRYNCFRYDRSLENDERGAVNAIPPKWKVGDEHCGFFLNIEEVFK